MECGRVEKVEGEGIMTDYEFTLVCAIRYELMKSEEHFKVTEYIESIIPKLSDGCLTTMTKDIKQMKKFKSPWEQRDWMCLLEQLEEEMGKRYGEGGASNEAD